MRDGLPSRRIHWLTLSVSLSTDRDRLKAALSREDSGILWSIPQAMVMCGCHAVIPDRDGHLERRKAGVGGSCIVFK